MSARAIHSLQQILVDHSSSNPHRVMWMQILAQTIMNGQMTERFYVHETNNMTVQKQFIVFGNYKMLWSTSRVKFSSWLNFTHSAPLIHQLVSTNIATTTLNPGPEVGKLFPWRASQYFQLWANWVLWQLLKFAIIAHKQPQTVWKQAGSAGFQPNFIYKNR